MAIQMWRVAGPCQLVYHSANTDQPQEFHLYLQSPSYKCLNHTANYSVYGYIVPTVLAE